MESPSPGWTAMNKFFYSSCCILDKGLVLIKKKKRKKEKQNRPTPYKEKLNKQQDIKEENN